MSHKPKDKFYTGGFLYNPKTKSILLHLRDGNTANNPNKWAFFGGISEGDESPKECFVREIKEELGIDLMESQIIPLCDYLNKERGIWRYVFYIESDLPISAMKLGEGADLRWITLDEVFKYDITLKTKMDLEIFINSLTSGAVGQ